MVDKKRNKARKRLPLFDEILEQICGRLGRKDCASYARPAAELSEEMPDY